MPWPFACGPCAAFSRATDELRSVRPLLSSSTNSQRTDELRYQQPCRMDHTDGRKVRKVTRACDACKAKKAKCSGTKPCDICSRKGSLCTYDALYLRGKPPTPAASATPGSSLVEHAAPRRSDFQVSPSASPTTSQNVAQSTSRTSPESGIADVQDPYTDPASGLSFLRRARRRFSQGKNHHHTDSVKQDWLYQHVSRAGDKPLLGEDHSWQLPPYRDALRLVEFYFDICVATYRVLNKPTVDKWFGIAENNRLSGKPGFHQLANAKAAALLGVLAISGFVEHTISGSADERESSQQSDSLMRQSLRLTEYEGGLPNLESIQARLILVFYHLMTCRFNHAWYIFGNCLQMISAEGLQR